MLEFDYDLFISYAHKDNEKLTAEQKGWIDLFHRALEIRLGQLLKKKEPAIWCDPELRGSNVFTEEITERLATSAIFISIISPYYVRSGILQKAEQARA